MLIILPPSETKAAGGDGSPLDFTTLSFPMLNPTRKDTASDLIRLPMSEVLGVLGVSAKQQKLAECNKVLMSSPTLPALLRFTGVLYDALSVGICKRIRNKEIFHPEIIFIFYLT